MAVTTTTQSAADLLINYVTSEIKTLEPMLRFATLGVRKDVPKGWNQLTFPQTNQIATSSVSTITQGTNPSIVTWGTSAYTAALTQYGIAIQLTDILMRNSAIELLTSAINQTKFALARQIDNSIQNVVNAGTQIVYAGGKASRAALAAGDLIDTTVWTNAIKKLRNANNAGLEPFAGQFYAAVIHPNAETDLMQNTSAGSWVDLGRYTSVDELRAGKMGAFRGGMAYTSANVQTFSSTTTVYPTTFLGKESFGWGYFQQPEPILITTADSNNVLNLFTTIGAKAALGTTRFDEVRIARVESAATA